MQNLRLTGTTQDKSKVKISQNFVDFSEYMNFTFFNFTNFMEAVISVPICCPAPICATNYGTQ